MDDYDHMVQMQDHSYRVQFEAPPDQPQPTVECLLEFGPHDEHSDCARMLRDMSPPFTQRFDPTGCSYIDEPDEDDGVVLPRLKELMERSGSLLPEPPAKIEVYRPCSTCGSQVYSDHVLARYAMGLVQIDQNPTHYCKPKESE